MHWPFDLTQPYFLLVAHGTVHAGGAQTAFVNLSVIIMLIMNKYYYLNVRSKVVQNQDLA